MKITLVIWISKSPGTADGITAFQMDIKIQGISFKIMEKALQQAREGRLHILGIMNQAIEKPRDSFLNLHQDWSQWKWTGPDRINNWSGRKTIQGMQRLFGVELILRKMELLILPHRIKRMRLSVRSISKNDCYSRDWRDLWGRYYQVMDFGAFVEIIPGKEGLLHISQIDNKRVEK